MTRSHRTGLDITPAGVVVAFLALAIYNTHSRYGAGTSLTLGSLAVAALVINLAWSWLAVRRASVDVVQAPTDATRGDRLPCAVVVSGLRGDALLTMTSSPNRPDASVAAGDHGVLLAEASFRGLASHAVFEVRVRRPFGLVGVRRIVTAPLPSPLLIGPRPRPAPETLDRFESRWSPGWQELWSVRAYVPGDPQRFVHWPSTARTGELMVREFTRQAEHVCVVVDLGEGEHHQAGEDTADRAAWILDELLHRGWRVELVTMVAGEPVSAAVRTSLEARRRLAVAGPGRPPPPTPGPERVLVVSVGGDQT